MAPDSSNDASCFLDIYASYGVWINSETRRRRDNNIQFGLLLFSLKCLMLGRLKKVGHGSIIGVWLSSEYASDYCNVSFQLEIFISLSCITLFTRVASWQYTLDIVSKNSCSGNTKKSNVRQLFQIYVWRY